ncbi:Beta-galactoside-binding lectin [Merluccius polli]|uniref:Galectin n=1 Tax=Merluccius polli TaxID=89951 RepID=A0AA47MPE3_MERPO|nr:Beta-galactoside-binding lectin [Merluccius polli]
MSFKEGAEFKIRVKPKDDGNSFAINVGHDSENIALHFNPRFEENAIVCNSLSGGCWGEEHREGSLPFTRGEECKFYLSFNMEYFYIKLPDGSTMSFPNRLGDVKYQFFSISGDARIVGIKINGNLQEDSKRPDSRLRNVPLINYIPWKKEAPRRATQGVLEPVAAPFWASALRLSGEKSLTSCHTQKGRKQAQYATTMEKIMVATFCLRPLLRAERPPPPPPPPPPPLLPPPRLACAAQ